MTTEVTTRKGEFARHWRALLAATIGVSAGVAVLPIYTNGLFFPSLEAEFGWSRSQLSSVQLVGSLIIIVTAPFVGVLVDRIGVRFPAAISLTALGVAYFVLSFNGPSFGVYLAVFAAMFVLAAASTAVPFTRAVNERFDRARGLALGISLSAVGLVAFLVPRLLGSVIAEDWRFGYQALGTFGLVSAVVVLLFMPSGRPIAAKSTAGPRLPLREIMVSSLFARLAAAFLFLALAVGGAAVHLVSFLRDSGATATSAANTAAIVGLSLIAGRFGCGLLIDRFFAPRVGAAVALIAAASFLSLVLVGPGVAYLAAVGIGLALGAEVDLIGYLVARYYGLEQYGRIFGIYYAVFFLGLGASPLLMATMREATGNYTLALSSSVVMLLIGSTCLLSCPAFARTDRHHTPTSTPLSTT